MMIPFSPPFIDNDVINEVTAALRSGWITTGPKTKALEKVIGDYVNIPTVLCLNSATAGLELMLRWFGVQAGDEVIVPCYTYSATANVVVHCGAKVVLVDVNREDFNISLTAIEKAITSQTKVIMPVDFAGMPCDYDELNELVRRSDIKSLFSAHTAEQKQLGRILILSDAAHSLGAIYKGKRTGGLCDATAFSFHAVKNLTTAEGGALCLNMPAPFDNAAIYKQLYIKSLHGQTKDALAKTQKGAWEYDIIEAGYKCNMPDIAAAIGLAQFKKYESHILPRRKQIFDSYAQAFAKCSWAINPIYFTSDKTSSYHVFPLRIKNCSAQQRNKIIIEIAEQDVTVNVHFKPIATLSFYKGLGFDEKDYPVAMENFTHEISLPVYVDLTDEQVCLVIDAVISAVSKVLS